MQIRSVAASPDRCGRTAFSLIELMVSMALTLFVMVVLTQAFTTSMETFSALQAVGELQANLRTVSSILQADLAADHFEGNRRLSSADLLTLPPKQGFFFVYQATPATPALPTVLLAPAPAPNSYEYEGTETTPSIGVPQGLLASWRANNHVLYFTVRNRGNRPDNFFTAAPLPSNLLTATGPGAMNNNFFVQPIDGLAQQANSFNSQWAEVCYFLMQTGTTTDPGNPSSPSGTPLYALYRSQYLLMTNPAYANNPANQTAGTDVTTAYPNVSCYASGSSLVFNGPDDVTNPAKRTLYLNWSPTVTINPPNPPSAPFPIKQSENPSTTAMPPNGSTLVVANVTSFQVQVFASGAADFSDVASYDSSNPANNPFNILAVKVTVRIWESTSKQSRQITVIQDM